jgi:uncharacterized membrane protein YphA (DoxX/SURF4 family)
MLRALNPKFRDQVRAWQWAHNSAGYDIIRIFLGLALIVRGIWFLTNPDAVQQMAGATLAAPVTLYLNAAHLIGGAMLALGFFTRIGAFIQIPILVEAVFFVHMRRGFGSPNQSLELAALVLLLLLVILLFGAGTYSIDHKRDSSRAR